jgi:hypothetical protein
MSVRQPTTLDLLAEMMPTNYAPCPSGLGTDLSVMIGGRVLRWHVETEADTERVRKLEAADTPEAYAELLDGLEAAKRCTADEAETGYALREVLAMLASERVESERTGAGAGPIVAAGFYRLRAAEDGGLRLAVLGPLAELETRTIPGAALRMASKLPFARSLIESLKAG